MFVDREQTVRVSDQVWSHQFKVTWTSSCTWRNSWRRSRAGVLTRKNQTLPENSRGPKPGPVWVPMALLSKTPGFKTSFRSWCSPVPQSEAFLWLYLGCFNSYFEVLSRHVLCGYCGTCLTKWCPLLDSVTTTKPRPDLHMRARYKTDPHPVWEVSYRCSDSFREEINWFRLLPVAVTVLFLKRVTPTCTWAGAVL